MKKKFNYQVYKDKENELEEKRKKFAEIANLKLNIKNIIFQLQIKKEKYDKIYDEYINIKNENKNINNEIKIINKNINKLKFEEKNLKSIFIKNNEYIDNISSIIKNDKILINNVNERENYENEKIKTNELLNEYNKKIHQLEIYKNEYLNKKQIQNKILNKIKININNNNN